VEEEGTRTVVGGACVVRAVVACDCGFIRTFWLPFGPRTFDRSRSPSLRRDVDLSFTAGDLGSSLLWLLPISFAMHRRSTKKRGGDKPIYRRSMTGF
jgi:hypothetical protein